ncbi:XVIPCD domain-containing protein [Lysobacter gummosus]|uniref:X-Tfes XVIPCD domain-containing protein n=2 Tax=Lysobacter gummosus TaxID=262324 RepID=A0ABY3XF12_9GAMM|nr:XVIPCD domain-containing protein [Lysobacter gummosus]ALN89589.1 hypothetical protein LG3211_0604 [Lysobacter gummosus]UNP30222.1 hypothetical protein MOV92_02780 [Lysobacter gummosus]
MNKQLDAAVKAFATSPGVSDAHVGHLREALVSDDELLEEMNKAAKLGRLTSFSISPTSESLVGDIDIRSGVVGLPISALAGSDAGSKGRLDAALKIQEMSLRFGNSTYKDEAGNVVPVSQEMVGNLQSAINASPMLVERIGAAINAEPKPHLKSFGILPHGQGAGAAYDGDEKAMLIPAYRLQNKSSANTSGFDVAPMVFTLAHETQHGFNHDKKREAWAAFDAEIKQIARDKNPVNDYTPPIGKFIQASREDEARAEIAGWNAVVSMKRQAGSEVSLSEMSRTKGIRSYMFLGRDDAAQQLVGKSGLKFNADSTIDPTPGNVEAMGKNYFDRKPKADGIESAETATLGPHKESDYQNYYGRNAIERVIQFDREYAHSVGGVEPKMHIDMGKLRLNERLIERLGLQIDPHPERPQAYYDTSQSPPALHHFEHTKTGARLNQHVPIESSVLADSLSTIDSGRPIPGQQAHPDHGLYSQIATQVRQQDQQHGRHWDEASERMTASLLALAKENGLSQVDHVVFSIKNEHVAAGENVFVVQGRLDDPAHLRAHMKTDEAARTPEAASFEKVEAINERIARQTAQAQALGQTPEETPKGPGMGR